MRAPARTPSRQRPRPAPSTGDLQSPGGRPSAGGAGGLAPPRRRRYPRAFRLTTTRDTTRGSREEPPATHAPPMAGRGEPLSPKRRRRPPRALTPLTLCPHHENTCMRCTWNVRVLYKPRAARSSRLTERFPPLADSRRQPPRHLLTSRPMSIWTRITEALAALVARGEGLLAVFDRRRAPERSVAFTIAVISLGAKMAKADGLVRPAEVAAFRQVFQIAPEDEAAGGPGLQPRPPGRRRLRRLCRPHRRDVPRPPRRARGHPRGPLPRSPSPTAATTRARRASSAPSPGSSAFAPEAFDADRGPPPRGPPRGPLAGPRPPPRRRPRRRSAPAGASSSAPTTPTR